MTLEAYVEVQDATRLWTMTRGRGIPVVLNHGASWLILSAIAATGAISAGSSPGTPGALTSRSFTRSSTLRLLQD
jgi:hypothetical protein